MNAQIHAVQHQQAAGHQAARAHRQGHQKIVILKGEEQTRGLVDGGHQGQDGGHGHHQAGHQIEQAGRLQHESHADAVQRHHPHEQQGDCAHHDQEAGQLVLFAGIAGMPDLIEPEQGQQLILQQQTHFIHHRQLQEYVLQALTGP